MMERGDVLWAVVEQQTATGRAWASVNGEG